MRPATSCETRAIPSRLRCSPCTAWHLMAAICKIHIKTIPQWTNLLSSYQTHNRYIAAVHFVTACCLTMQRCFVILSDCCRLLHLPGECIRRLPSNYQGAESKLWRSTYSFNRLGYISRQYMIGTPCPYCDKGDPAYWPTPRLPIRGHNNRDATTSSWKFLAA